MSTGFAHASAPAPAGVLALALAPVPAIALALAPAPSPELAPAIVLAPGTHTPVAAAFPSPIVSAMAVMAKPAPPPKKTLGDPSNPRPLDPLTPLPRMARCSRLCPRLGTTERHSPVGPTDTPAVTITGHMRLITIVIRFGHHPLRRRNSITLLDYDFNYSVCRLRLRMVATSALPPE